MVKLKHQKHGVKQVESLRSFCKEYHLPRSQMREVINGKQWHCKGWFLDDSH